MGLSPLREDAIRNLAIFRVSFWFALASRPGNLPLRPRGRAGVKSGTDGAAEQPPSPAGRAPPMDYGARAASLPTRPPCPRTLVHHLSSLLTGAERVECTAPSGKLPERPLFLGNMSSVTCLTHLDGFPALSSERGRMRRPVRKMVSGGSDVEY